MVSSIFGPALVADTGAWGTYAWTQYLLGVPGMRIAGGSDEVMRNISASGSSVCRRSRRPPSGSGRDRRRRVPALTDPPVGETSFRQPPEGARNDGGGVWSPGV